MKNIFAFLLITVFLISGCSFDVQVVTPEPSRTTLPSVIQSATSPALVASVPATMLTPYPGYTPTTSDPVFFGAYVASEQAAVLGQTRFSAGTKQIFAIWSYQNMQAGLTIKREWYLDGQLWLTREEPWDFANYGASGILQDVSIYDFDAGLPSGTFKLIVSIDGVAQPIGKRIIEGTAETDLEFEILPVNEATSPNGQLKATSLVERLVLTDANGTQSDLFVGREIVSMLWLDNQRLLFVDRDRSEQVSNLLVGVRDELWIADIVSRETWSLYKGETTLGSTGGLYPSPNGKYIAGIAGSGFGDACFLDSQVIFFEIAGDYKSVKTIQQEQFLGIPRGVDKVIYPVAVGTWQSNTQYRIALNGTCGTDPSLMGFYLFDLSGLKANQDTSDATPFSMGDLGWGEVHGVVTDAVTGMAIAGATVTCEHSSYSSTAPAICSGSVETGIPGVYIFQRVFFHDTDTIRLTVTAPGYQSQEISQNSFTRNDMTADFSLLPLP